MANEDMKVAILSYAHTFHAASYTRALAQTPGVEVAAVYDEDLGRGLGFAQEFGVRSVYPMPDELLARDDIRAVVVCSPTSEHAALVSAAARAGKHVLCEKPIATRLDDARVMIRACREAQVQLHVAFVCRFYPMVQKVKAMLDAGELGVVRGIAGGNRGVPPLDYPAWIRDPSQAGGGALLDHSVHVTDAMRYLLGSEVTSVFAEAGTLLNPGMVVEDCALLLLKFRNGVVASVDPSWSIPARNPYPYDFYLRILGTTGAILLDDTRQAVRVVSDRPTDRGVVLEPFGVDCDVAMVRHFIHCISEEQALPPRASGEDGLRALEIALAAYQSAQSGQPVAVDSVAT